MDPFLIGISAVVILLGFMGALCTIAWLRSKQQSIRRTDVSRVSHHSLFAVKDKSWACRSPIYKGNIKPGLVHKDDSSVVLMGSVYSCDIKPWLAQKDVSVV